MATPIQLSLPQTFRMDSDKESDKSRTRHDIISDASFVLECELSLLMDVTEIEELQQRLDTMRQAMEAEVEEREAPTNGIR